MDEKKRKKFIFFYKKLWSHLAVKEKERNGGKKIQKIRMNDEAIGWERLI